ALLDVLRTGGVEVERVSEPFQGDGREVAAGAHVVRMAQPASAFAKTVLEVQRYPELHGFPGGPPQRPSDVTAHTLPLLMGVDVRTLRQPFTARLERAPEDVAAGPSLPAGAGFLAFGHRSAELRALARLLRAGVPVRWASAPFVAGDRRFPLGTLLA